MATLAAGHYIPSMAITFEIVTDYICPWCYLSTVRTHKLQQVYDLNVVHTFFPLHPNTPPEGMLLKDYFRGRNFDIASMHQQMKSRMEAEGLTYPPGERIINSRLAQELGKWADQQGRVEIHDILYRVHHSEGRDISDPKVLIAAATQVGLDPAEAALVLSERRMKAAIDADWEKSTQAGVTGVPTFIAANRAVVGAQPYEMLEKLIRLAGAQAKN